MCIISCTVSGINLTKRMKYLFLGLILTKVIIHIEVETMYKEFNLSIFWLRFRTILVTYVDKTD